MRRSNDSCLQQTLVQVHIENTLNYYVARNNTLKMKFKDLKLSDYLPLN